MGGPNDPRVMSLEELEQYARQFDTGEDINVYDFSKIDFDSPFFTSLPASDRYNILNAARLRSRLRMGYSKEQLDDMFPDRMAFSRFQIERVTERNELTQRLMNLNGMGDDGSLGMNGVGRVAGEKGREYVLVKNEGVEGGWALGVVSSKEEGERSKPIDVEAVTKQVKVEDEEEWEDDDDFEDVPIEGLNRLPKRADTSAAFGKDGTVTQEIAERRRAFYKSRRQGASSTRKAPKPNIHDPESLFMAEEEGEEVWENVDIAPTNDDLFEEQQEDEDEELSRAIALSLQQEGAELNHPDEPNDYMEVFEQAKAVEPKPLPKGSGMAIAHIVNSRANKAAPVPQPFPISDSDEDDIDLQAALAESRKSKYKSHRLPPRPVEKARVVPTPSPVPTQPRAPQSAGFSGPLPFEKLDLGSSLLGKKKMKQLKEDKAGGFETDINKTAPKPAEPLPPWFSGDIRKGAEAQKAIEDEDRKQQRQLAKQFRFQEKPKLRTQDSREVIDLDAPKSQPKEVIDVDSDGEDHLQGVETGGIVVENSELRMGDLADLVRAEPPQQPDEMQNDTQTSQRGSLLVRPQASIDTGLQGKHSTSLQPPDFQPPDAEGQLSLADNDGSKSDEEFYEWEASDTEGAAHDINKQKRHQKSTVTLEQPEGEQTGVNTYVKPAGGMIQLAPSRTSSLDSVNVGIPIESEEPQAAQTIPAHGRQSSVEEDGPIPMSDTADQDLIEADPANDDNIYSDPEDEELMMQLAIEAEEHARFASTMNNKTQKQNIEDYERELQQLRTQQKKDRRDADEVTHIMMTECQQLLKLFGLPYITAPMEAEAQCAELVSLGLVDGIVTDDSDIFLFGGTRVYKNMFNQAKFVECYLSSDLEKDFDLTRRKLIRIAHLLGSDYTEGLPGVGPVTALEILSEFPTLEDFRDWWQGVQMGNISKAEDAKTPFRKKFRRNATKLFLPPVFPDQRVDVAYLEPDVDSDPSPFQWGVPDLDALRSFLMATIGWTQERTDEVLVPVIRDMNRRMDEGTQSNITSFFQGGGGAGAFAPRRRGEGKSKRMESALGRMAEQAKRRSGGESEHGNGNDDVVGNVEENGSRRGIEAADGEELVRGADAVIAISGSLVDAEALSKPTSKSTRGRARGTKRTAPAPAPASENEDEDGDGEYEAPRKKTKKGTGGKRVGRGRGKAAS
ncbi:DNA repair protein rad2 [Cryomyces antarcticus]|nr:DNA repair protein rad2 [Cryomyces antarcticus]